jgi:prepilin-type N-terminal cleavage/methylation domain-containing protein
MRLYKNNTGFTLIELLVVIAIISLLSSVVMSSLNSARSKARDAQRISDVKQFTLALGLYYDKYGSYINTIEAGFPLGIPTNATTALAPLVTEGFIPSISTNPNPISCGKWGNTVYVYGSSVWDIIGLVPGSVCPSTTDNNSYAIEFCLENPNDAVGARYSDDGCGRYCYVKCVY